LTFPGHNCEKYSNIKFHENSSIGKGVVPCGRMDGRTNEWKDGVTDMRKLKVAFYNFVIASDSKQRKEWK